MRKKVSQEEREGKESQAREPHPCCTKGLIVRLLTLSSPPCLHLFLSHIYPLLTLQLTSLLSAAFLLINPFCPGSKRRTFLANQREADCSKTVLSSCGKEVTAGHSVWHLYLMRPVENDRQRTSQSSWSWQPKKQPKLEDGQRHTATQD